MLYDAYEVQRSFLAGASKLAGMGAGWLNNPANPLSYSSMGPVVLAGNRTSMTCTGSCETSSISDSSTVSCTPA